LKVDLNKKIAVLGIGYVGLPLAITLAKAGYEVVGVDINKKVVEALNQGKLPLKEKGIEAAFKERDVQQRFTASLKPCSADVYIVCVQTPLDSTTKLPDLSYVVSATESIIPFLRKGNLIIIESTLPPLTCRNVMKPIVENHSKMKVGRDVFLALCTERILPGETFYELIHNNRVIGGIDTKSAELAKEIYASFVKGDIDLVDDITAEMVKLTENTFRDVNVALANEFSLVAETLGVNIKEVIRLANKHPRVKVLSPGIGVGGHCLPKDPWFLVHSDPKNTGLIQTARKVNEQMPSHVASKIRKALREVKDPKIVVLGMTYKPDSDDLRESPSLEIIRILEADGYDVTAYDNLVKDHEYRSILDIAKGADCLAVLVEHTSIKRELAKHERQIKSMMRSPIVLRIGASYRPDAFDARQRGR
jgi:UDP-N-acetyl-D-mannosaminuronic acid dehydrogenase